MHAHARLHTRMHTAQVGPQPPRAEYSSTPRSTAALVRTPPRTRTARERAAYRYVSFASELIQLPIVPFKRFEPSPLRSTARAHQRTDRRSGPCRAFPPR